MASYRDPEISIDVSVADPRHAVASLREAIAFRLLEAALREIEGVQDIEEDMDQISSFVVRRSDGTAWRVTVAEPGDPAMARWMATESKSSRVVLVAIDRQLLDARATARAIVDQASAGATGGTAGTGPR